MGNPNMRKPLTFNSSVKKHLANKGFCDKMSVTFKK